MGDCIFCAIVTGDAPSQRVDEDEHTVTFMDINPATDGHCLVVPKRHAENVLDIPVEDARAVMAAAHRVAGRIRETLSPAGVNLVHAAGAAAFQTVFHFHMHVVPRYEGDPIKLPWIPTPGDPDRIADIAERLRSGAR